MQSLFIGFVASFLATLFVVRSAKSHAHLSNDHDFSGPQKFHAVPVPRIGGVGIAVGVVLAVLLTWFPAQVGTGRLGVGLLLCAIPAFFGGLIEDLTKRVNPRERLVLTALSAAAAAWWLSSTINRTDIPGLDWVVSFGLGAGAVTVFAVAGVANAVNIIDGFNGLASMCVVLIQVALAYVAFEVGDRELMILALTGIGAVLGFFVWNYPGGLIFLGDGGAYFLGFWVAEIAILLLHRNPSVSPLFPLVACIYPIFETVFTIYRRKFLRDVSPGLPDGIHLHSLVYRRIVRWAAGHERAKHLTKRNSMTSPYLWLLCMSSLVPAVWFWDNTPMLAFVMLTFVVGYVTVYWRIVRFRAPKWMVPKA